HQTLLSIDTATGHVSRTTPIPGGHITGETIAVGAGRVWVTDAAGLVRIEPSTRRVVVIRLEGGGQGLAIGHGVVFVSGRAGAEPAVYRVNGSERQASGVQQIPIRGSSSLPIVAESGSVWAPSISAVYRLDQDLSGTPQSLSVPIGGHLQITYAAGSVWVP